MMRNHYMDTHYWEQVMENVRFMTEAGENFDRIATRLGFTVETLQRQMERHRERQTHPDQVPTSREGAG